MNLHKMKNNQFTPLHTIPQQLQFKKQPQNNLNN